MKRGFLATVALALAMGSVAFHGGDAWAQIPTDTPTVEARPGGFNDDGREAKVDPGPGMMPFVVMPFSVTADSNGSAIDSVKVRGTSGSVANDVILRLSLYRDLNENGRIDFNDPRIATMRNTIADSSADSDGDGAPDYMEFDQLDDDNDGTTLNLLPDGETLAAAAAGSPRVPPLPDQDAVPPAGEKRFYLVVVDSMATYVDVVGGDPGTPDAQDTNDFDFTAIVEFADPDVPGEVTPANIPGDNDKELQVKATKLSFTSAPSAFPQGQGTTGTGSIRATDDYGNLDEDVSGAVELVAVLYASPGTTADGNLSGSASLTGGDATVNLSYTEDGVTTTDDEIITVVATHTGGTPTGIKGSHTMRSSGGAADVGSGALISRGVEFYDVDHNGLPGSLHRLLRRGNSGCRERGRRGGW